MTLQLIVDILISDRGRGGLSGRLDSLGGLLGNVLCRRRGGLSLGRLGGLDISLVVAVLLDEVEEVLNGTRSSVVNGRVLGLGGEELNGGEAGNVIRNVVGSGIDLGNDDLVLVLRVLEEELAEFLKISVSTVLND